jgi:hypothetical protein
MSKNGITTYILVISVKTHQLILQFGQKFVLEHPAPLEPLGTTVIKTSDHLKSDYCSLVMKGP